MALNTNLTHQEADNPMRFTSRFFIWTLLIAILLTACRPVPTTLMPTVSSMPAPTVTSQPVAAATSRGDKLEASDPASVKYGAGHPVLVEFFRFT
jgi:hypothetical protein